MTALAIVEHFNVVEDISTALSMMGRVFPQIRGLFDRRYAGQGQGLAAGMRADGDAVGY